MDTNKKHYFYIDVLRVIACYFVIFNHTASRGYYLYVNYDPSNIRYWLYLFLSIFCTMSVPLFFSISGALLIPKEESIKTLYVKRILPKIAVLILISLVYYIFYNGTVFTIDDFVWFVIQTYTSNVAPHLWFLYSYIAFLITLPLLRQLAKNMKSEHYLYMIVLVLFFNGILPIFEYFYHFGEYHINSSFNINWILSTIVLYPCIGYYLNELDILKSKKYLVYLWAVNILAIFISCYLTYFKANYIGGFSIEEFETFFGSFTIINVVTLFITAKVFFYRKERYSVVDKVLLSIGNCSFGIYLFHIIFKNLFFKTIFSFFIYLNINDMLACNLSCLVIMFMCYLLTLILKKVPFFRKLI